jgi:hypothetical protein
MYLSIVCLSCEHLIAGILHSSKICKLFIENTLLDNDLQACLIGDFNAHTGNVSEYHCY